MAAKTNVNKSLGKAYEQGVMPATVGRVSKDSVKKKITLSITQEDSDAVKMYALKNHTTVSDLLHEWILTNCQD